MRYTLRETEPIAMEFTPLRRMASATFALSDTKKPLILQERKRKLPISKAGYMFLEHVNKN